ncbi:MULTISPECIES: hypothetical protein [Clostridium]|uniref:Histidine kinase N-terminal 7TM region domain-containing protein n=1 Tax=Clostridium lapidicellarium TaxID=3240931 RepID=A0ABV4DTH5_9CLOT|nr:hypothetical protein [uncultured Clostridium sp.]
MFYIYICLLPIMFVMIVKGLVWTKLLPSKVKIMAFFILTAMMFRYICILILFLDNNIKYLYMLKMPFFLNLIAVPMIALTLIYIFMRRDNIKFHYIFILSALLCVLYGFTVYNCGAVVKNVQQYPFVWGYTMNFPKDSYIYWSYVLFNTLVLFFSLGFMGKNNPNRFGIYMMVFAAAVTSAELIAWFLNVNILVQPILGDMSWIAVFIYVLNKIKKRVASG